MREARMHIPDGMISPVVYLPAYGVAGGLWAFCLRRIRSVLRQETIPQMAVLAALSFVAMTVMVPLPGGTSVHASGIALLALLFGVPAAFVAVSLVLLLQATVLGVGGVTVLPINALAMGIVGGGAARASYRLLHRVHEDLALFAAGWLSVNAAALVLAVVLGAQPLIAHDAAGAPLFFPFGPSITLPAIMLPHVAAGIGEGVLTVLVWRLVRRSRWFPER